MLHGIHDQGQSVAALSLVPFLHAQGLVLYPDYGWIAGLETRRINPVVIGSIAPYLWADDVLVCHSNGCAIAYGALQRGAQVRGLILIDGALRRDLVLPSCVKFCHVYFNAGDTITEVAQIAEELPESLVDQNWGDLGHAGYSGTDPRIVNFDCGATKGMPVVSGHSDIFTPDKIAAWGPFIAERLAEAY